MNKEQKKQKQKKYDKENVPTTAHQHARQLLYLRRKEPQLVKPLIEELFLKSIILEHLELTQKGEHGAAIDLEEALNLKL